MSYEPFTLNENTGHRHHPRPRPRPHPRPRPRPVAYPQPYPVPVYVDAGNTADPDAVPVVVVQKSDSMGRYFGIVVLLLAILMTAIVLFQRR